MGKEVIFSESKKLLTFLFLMFLFYNL